MNRRASGFSLVEMMIGLAVGMVVVASVVAFTVSTVSSVGRNIGATRVMQELRGAMSVMTREIKRAGYDRDAINGIASGVFPSGYAALTINPAGDCMLMSYDRVGFNDAGNVPGAGEWKADDRVGNGHPDTQPPCILGDQRIPFGGMGLLRVASRFPTRCATLDRFEAVVEIVVHHGTHLELAPCLRDLLVDLG